MRKAKLNKGTIKEIKYHRADTITTLIAGVEYLMRYTTDYFEVQDTAFYKPYMDTVTWCFKYLDRFYEKLIATGDCKKSAIEEGSSKFNYLISEALTLNSRNIGFNILNDREKSDYAYYKYVSASIDVIEAMIFILKRKEEYLWAAKYFTVIKIQLRSICKIFESELNYTKK